MHRPQSANSSRTMPMIDEPEEQPFICPNCGGSGETTTLCVSTAYDPKKPETAVLQYITCAGCGANIPAHLGQRWDGMSEEEAEGSGIAYIAPRPCDADDDR